MDIILGELALDDLKTVFLYYESYSRDLANKSLDKFNDFLNNLKVFPQMGTIFEDTDYRKIPLSMFKNYVLFYEIDHFNNIIYVHRILNVKNNFSEL